MNDTLIKGAILAAIFGAVLITVDVLVGWWARSHSEGRAINLRLKFIQRGRSTAETLTLLKRAHSALPPWLPRPLLRMGRAVERMLMMAQITIPTPRLMLILMLAPIAILFTMLLIMVIVGAPVGFGRVVLLGTFSLVLGLFLPLMVLQVRANRMRKRMQEQFPIALDVFVRGLRAGHPVAAALDLLTVELPDPIGSQFGVVVDEVTYGAELRDALHAMAERWDLADMRMFVVSLAVQNETGGNLSEVLENLAQVIRARQSLMLTVRALSSEGRMTAVVLTALPILAFTALFSFNPGFYLDVADDPYFVPGFLSLIALYAVGFITIRRMVDIKV
ncbi:type II secretion system F family protein [Sphingomonas alba]|uniref:Type II secretion system F family protein n=1 Tax=Sphingomonas alba TaxID=2908208 RepID=A0ABT0RQE5_9SPHN|nr:type II secretion system F family protein [Sphingomonas alba]MCL6684509.1 type II secretion system F family protein [Sphingomonas alba]